MALPSGYSGFKQKKPGYPPEYDPDKHTPPPHRDFWEWGYDPKYGYVYSESYVDWARGRGSTTPEEWFTDKRQYLEKTDWYRRSWKPGEYEEALNNWRIFNNISGQEAQEAAEATTKDKGDWQQRAAGYAQWAQQQLGGLQEAISPYQAQQQQLLAQMQARARGEDLLTRQAGQIQRERMQQALTGEAARRGRYGPAIQRQILERQAAMGKEMAGRQALAEAQEQQAAQAAYGQALGQQKAWEAGMENLRQQLMGFGRGTEMSIEQAEMQRQAMAQQSKQFQQQMAQRHAAMQEQKRQADRNFWSKIAMGGLSAIGGLLGGPLGAMGGSAAGQLVGGMIAPPATQAESTSWYFPQNVMSPSTAPRSAPMPSYGGFGGTPWGFSGGGRGPGA